MSFSTLMGEKGGRRKGQFQIVFTIKATDGLVARSPGMQHVLIGPLPLEDRSSFDYPLCMALV